MERVFRVLMAVMLAVAVGGGGAPANARPSGPVPGLPIQLALGDSIANGQQSADIIPGDYWGTAAEWQASGYVGQYHEVLVDGLDCVPGKGRAAGPGCRNLQLLNLARSAVPKEVEPPGKKGVTTELLIAEQLPEAVALLQARNADANPRNDIPVVTLTVGGNDIFGPIASACLPTPGPECPSAIGDSFATFAANYGQILAQLRAAAGPDAQIVTMTYYNPLPYCALGAGDPAGAKAFGDFILEGGSFAGVELPFGLNTLIRGMSAANGAVVADTFGQLGEGDFVGGLDCLHPNLSGHTKIAAAFAAAYAG